MPILLVTNKCVASRQTRDYEGIGQRRSIGDSASSKSCKRYITKWWPNKSFSRAAPSSIGVTSIKTKFARSRLSYNWEAANPEINSLVYKMVAFWYNLLIDRSHKAHTTYLHCMHNNISYSGGNLVSWHASPLGCLWFTSCFHTAAVLCPILSLHNPCTRRSSDIRVKPREGLGLGTEWALRALSPDLNPSIFGLY